MADRYWVNGAGTWVSGGTTKWSASSGGSTGASVPTASDNVFIDTGSGSPGIITISGAQDCNNLNITALGLWTITGTSTAGITTRGNVTIPNNFTWTLAGSLSCIFTATRNLSINPATGIGPVVLNGAGVFNLLTNITSRLSSYGFTLSQGTLNLNNFSIQCGTFTSNSADLRQINFGTGNITVVTTTAGACISCDNATNLSFSGTDGFRVAATVARTISMGSTTAGATIQTAPPNLTVTSGSSIVTITNGGIFKNLDFS
jgi:hypothetical protein